MRISLPLLATGATIGLTTFLYYLSVQYIPASLAIILLMQFVWMGIGLDWLLFRQRPGRQHLFCLALIFAGTLLSSGVFSDTGSVQPAVWKGVGLALLSALLYAIFVVANSRAGKDLPPFAKAP